jgi:hypothetical protein
LLFADIRYLLLIAYQLLIQNEDRRTMARIHFTEEPAGKKEWTRQEVQQKLDAGLFLNGDWEPKYRLPCTTQRSGLAPII